MKFIAPLALALVAQPALSACPTRADVDDGIVLVQNTPFFVRADIERTPEGMRLEQLIRTDLGTTRSASLLAHAFAPLETVTPEGITRYRYDGDPQVFDHIDQLGLYSLTATARRPDGESTQVTLDLRFEGHGHIDLAECGYDTLYVRLRRIPATGPTETSFLHFAPALGLILAADGDASFRYQWIGTAADVAR
jgi:hypothetical protein